ncbi:nucleoporin 133 [Heterostelium album PN500]|uniref:Nucleoporin 133 n=1 Tax=Heterostelium pallidum (strain ATCC 26659 / Pp 5 / PN500) TaxID=670386 RepID=D3B9I7_HETP5|nr:nucleoporin 133 [Heterostelium album PN500]EFA81899.1 nucleoporin 133 [Heterostelium album PN500]|eukprot:XP_020434016.1 nucleoporin 133 [Heterostelium album PN500]
MEQGDLSVLVFGSSGFIGSKVVSLFESNRAVLRVIHAKSRLENRQDIENEILETKPNRIVNCAGLTGRPNIDWCEDHKVETIRTNVIGHLNLLDIANKYNIHLTVFGTGCLYQYDNDKHSLNSDKGFTEEDPFNYSGSFYSKTKGIMEELTSCYSNVLTLRVRLPISDSMDEERNLVRKLIGYEKVINVKNSMTVLYDLLPVAVDMCIMSRLGVYNFTNPGTISHNEILDLYKQYIDPTYQYKNFTVDEQSKILKSGRCNCELDTTKLQSLYPSIPHISDSINLEHSSFIKMHYLKRKTKSATSFFGVGTSASDNENQTTYIDSEDIVMDNDDDHTPSSSSSLSSPSTSSPSLQSSTQKQPLPSFSNNSNSNNNNINRSSTKEYDIQVKFDIPNSIKLAIDQSYNDSNDHIVITGFINYQGVAFIILPNELYIWSLDKTTSYDKLELPYQMDVNQICVTRNKKNYDTYTAFYVTNDGSVRYWSQTNRPSQSQDISLDYRTNTNVFITECDPFGVVIANALGTIHLVSIGKGTNTLTSKMINKSQGLLGYLYLAKQPPVLTVLSVPQVTSAQRQVYVLTENSLIKYEINENGERVLLEYSLQRDIQQLFNLTGNVKLVDLSLDSDSQDECDTISILVQHLINQQSKRFYLMSLQVKQNQVHNSKKIDNLYYQCNENQYEFNSKPKVMSIMKKHCIYWLDTIYYFSEYQFKGRTHSSGTIRLEYPMIAAGVTKNEFFFIDRPNAVQNLSIPPLPVDLPQNDRSNELNIIFDIPEEEDQIGSIRNILLRSLNSYAMKRQNALQQSLEVCAKIDKKSFDLAARRVSAYIVDQLPAANYWASGTDVLHHLGSNMSVQLKQQIEDKRKRYQIFTAFLQEFGFKSQLSRDTQAAIDANQCRLAAAADLRDFQNLQEGSSTLLTRLIQAAVSARLGANWQNSAMNVYELFYSNISMLDDILLLIVKELRDIDINYTDSLLKLKTLLEADSIALKLLSNYTPNMLVNQQQQQQQQSTGTDPIYLMVRLQIDTINRFIETDLKTGPANFLLTKLSDASLAHSEHTLYEQLHDLVVVYLDAVRFSASTDNELKSIHNLATQMNATFVQSGRFAAALDIAHRFSDYHTIVQVYINDTDNREQQHKMLIISLRTFLNNSSSSNSQSNDYSESITRVYQYMLDCGLRQELLQLPEEFSQSVTRYLESYPQISWVNSLKHKQWNAAAKTLLEESQRENQSLSRKKTLMSLAKLSLLAEEKEPSSKLDKTIDTTNQRLELIKIQKEFLPDQKTPITPAELIKEILNSNGYRPMDKYAICLNTLEESNMIIKPEERIKLFKLILLNAFDNGGAVELSSNLVEHINISDTQFDLLIYETDFFQLLHHLPTDPETTSIIKSFIDEYHQERQKQILNQAQKGQFTRILHRVLELCKQE